MFSGSPLNQQDADHQAATLQKLELDRGGRTPAPITLQNDDWNNWLRDTIADHQAIYREAAEAADALRACDHADAVAMRDIDRVASAPYAALLEAAREVIGVEDAYGEMSDDGLTAEQFHERESAWSTLRELCAGGGS